MNLKHGEVVDKICKIAGVGIRSNPGANTITKRESVTVYAWMKLTSDEIKECRKRKESNDN